MQLRIVVVIYNVNIVKIASTTSALPNDSIAELYSAHQPWLMTWLRRRLGDAADAADLAQDTFVKVMMSSSSEEIRQPRPFLATIARRLMADQHRKRLLESSYLEMLAHMPEELAPSPEDRLQALQTLYQLDAVLDALPAAVREAFLLAHLQEMSYVQIAQRLHVSTSSVKQYLTRANRQCLFAIAF